MKKKKKIAKEKAIRRNRKKSICRYLICIIYNTIKGSIKKKLIVQKIVETKAKKPYFARNNLII